MNSVKCFDPVSGPGRGWACTRGVGRLKENRRRTTSLIEFLDFNDRVQMALLK